MKFWWAFARLLLYCMTGLMCCKPVQAWEMQQEYVTTTPVFADGVLYIASTTFPDHRGHLRAIDLLDTFPVTLWDAADTMPQAGIGAALGDLTNGDPPTSINPGNLYRSIFTNFGGEQLPFTPGVLVRLQTRLDVASLTDAEILLHAVRGRRGGTAELPVGPSEDPRRLWSISRSSPVLVGRSPVNNEASQRDRVIYAGGEDGMLHAFFVSPWDADSSDFMNDDSEAGAELWAYLPGSFLPHLKGQPLDDDPGALGVHLDGHRLSGNCFSTSMAMASVAGIPCWWRPAPLCRAVAATSLFWILPTPISPNSCGRRCCRATRSVAPAVSPLTAAVR